MTQEDKQLLLKDLCARLPYLETWIRYEDKDYVTTGYCHRRVSLLLSPFSSGNGPWPLIEEVKPYLRPLESMTEEEYNSIDWEDCRHVIYYDENGFRFVKIDSYTIPVLDWLNEHHFDYRRLIEKGLALEAPEGMYKTE